jgi:hypothetical protein
MKQISPMRASALAFAIALAGCASQYNPLPAGSVPQSEGIYAPAGPMTTIQAGPGYAGTYGETQSYGGTAYGTSSYGASGPGTTTSGTGEHSCETFRMIMSAPPDQRQAMMERYEPNVPADAQQDYFATMQERCK